MLCRGVMGLRHVQRTHCSTAEEALQILAAVHLSLSSVMTKEISHAYMPSYQIFLPLTNKESLPNAGST